MNYECVSTVVQALDPHAATILLPPERCGATLASMTIKLGCPFSLTNDFPGSGLLVQNSCLQKSCA